MTDSRQKGEGKRKSKASKGEKQQSKDGRNWEETVKQRVRERAGLEAGRRGKSEINRWGNTASQSLRGRGKQQGKGGKEEIARGYKVRGPNTSQFSLIKNIF